VRKDIVLEKDTPFFATSDAPLALVMGGSVDRVNTEMMDVRWRCSNYIAKYQEMNKNI
jgi:hypothetical protein